MKTALLKMYCALLFIAALMINTAQAQIIYTDIVPDTTIIANGGFYFLDLNNDSTFDFKINHTSSYLCSAQSCTGHLTYSNTIDMLNGGGVVTSGSYPLALNAGADIKNGGYSWQFLSGQTLAYHNQPRFHHISPPPSTCYNCGT